MIAEENVIQRMNTMFHHSHYESTVTETCLKVSSQACEKGCHGDHFSSRNLFYQFGK